MNTFINKTITIPLNALRGFSKNKNTYCIFIPKGEDDNNFIIISREDAFSNYGIHPEFDFNEWNKLLNKGILPKNYELGLYLTYEQLFTCLTKDSNNTFRILSWEV